MTGIKIAALIVTGLCFVANIFSTKKMFKYVKEAGFGYGYLIFDIVITLGTLGLFIYNITRVVLL